MYSDSDNENENGSGDEYSEEEQEVMKIKPVFIPKAQRLTVSAKEREEFEAKQRAEKQLQEKETRKQHAKSLVAETIRRNEEMKELLSTEGDSDAGMPKEEDSDYDEEVEYEAWKLRELGRLKRDAEEREAMLVEKAEIARRRNMTDEERMAEDKKLGKMTWQEARDNKPKWKFLQKYYHKGVFYMDEDSLKKTPNDARLKDYNAPTLEDNVDKEKLPQIMQVKNFGKKGRTKYTHLLDQDTTVKGNQRIDVRPDRRVLESYLGKRSGIDKHK